MNEAIVLVCDNDESVMQQIKEGLASSGFETVTISDATKLVSRALDLNPRVIIANPDMNGFNEYDVCKKLMNERHIPIILLLDRNSTTRNQIDTCNPEDTVTKPLNLDLLANLVSKHFTITSNTANKR